MFTGGNMAEIDISKFISGLNKEGREAVYIAALMGMRFSLDHLLDLGRIKPSKLLEILDIMKEKSLVRDDRGGKKGVYQFASKSLPGVIVGLLTQEAKETYLHKIIDYIEQELSADNKKPLVLAELYLQLSGPKDNLRYKKQAADLVAASGKTELAQRLYKEIIDAILAEPRNDPLENLMLVDAVISYSHVAVNIRPPDELIPLIMRTMPIARKLNNKRAEAMLEVRIGRLYQSKGLNIEAFKHYEKASRIAEETQDQFLIKTISKFSALALFWKGKIRDAIQRYEQTLGNIEDFSADFQDFWAYLMLSYCYGINGRIARGLGLAEVLRDRALAQKNLKAQAFAEAVIALILLEIRHVDDAVSHIDTAISIGKKLKSNTAIWMAMPCKAFVLYSKGDINGAKEILASGLAHAQKVGAVHYPSPWLLEILWSLQKSDLEPIRGYSFASEIARLMNWPDIYMKGAALRYASADKMLSHYDPGEIEHLLCKSQELLNKSGAIIELGRTQVELAKLYIDQKDEENAKISANKAYATFLELDNHLFPSELLFLIQNKPVENRMLKGISELGKAIDSSWDPDRYLGKVVAVLANMFGAERAAVILRGDKDDDASLTIAAARNLSPEELEQIQDDPLKKLIFSTLAKKEPLIINEPGHLGQLSRSSSFMRSVKSLACIPLVIHTESIGMIYIDNRLLEGIFSDKDLVILTAVAGQVALYLRTRFDYKDSPQSGSVPADNYSAQEIYEDEKRYPYIVGKSKAIKDVLRKIEKVSDSDTTVLILGETGVGKELVAKTIHQNSRRSDHPFVVVNISALSKNLLESELFGHEKGAFTGADKIKHGRFEIAHKGTIFLDEIGELSMEAQVKLLRVLQEGSFERVGGTQTINSDFRLIAATNRNLSDMVAKGDFRLDLFYRIDIFPIEIPPLRKRQTDIAILSHHFLKKYAAKHQKNVGAIPRDALSRLMNYSWPGNVRELEHFIERSLIISEGDELFVPEFKLDTVPIPREEAQTELLSLDDVSRRHIITVLDHTKWRIRGDKGAAKILKIKPSTLEYRMKKLGIKK